MKIIITGANGFIGSYLTNFLRENNYHIIPTSRNGNTPFKELEAIQLDVLNKHDLEQSLQADVIIHTATSNDIISKDTAKGIELSAVGTKNILDFAVRNKIPRLIYFSTFQVYGTELAGEIDEQTPTSFTNDYGLNHLFGEMYCEMYTRLGKVQCTVVRPSNVYGQIMSETFNRWTLVPGCFCQEVKNEHSITLRSSGKQMRNFVNLQNLSRGVHAILQHQQSNYQIYNLASTVQASMADVAKIVQQCYFNLYGSHVPIKILSNEPTQSNIFRVSLDKLYEIGFSEDTSYNLESEIIRIFHFLNNKTI